MCNHIHILVEVPPMPEGGVPDNVFLKRLSAIYGDNFVADVAGQLDAARSEGGLEGGIRSGLKRSRDVSPTGCMTWGSS
jgi:hypothetical protein